MKICKIELYRENNIKWLLMKQYHFLRGKVDLLKLYHDPSLPLKTIIYIAETLSNLLDKWIKRITPDP